MAGHTVEIIISPEGEMTTIVKGIKGRGCKNIKWMDALGIVVEHKSTSDENKRDNVSLNTSNG